MKNLPSWRQKYRLSARLCDYKGMTQSFELAPREDYGIFDNHYLRLGIKLREGDYLAARNEIDQLRTIEIPNKSELESHRAIASLVDSIISLHECTVLDAETISCFQHNALSNYNFLSGFVNGGYLGIDFVFPKFSQLVANYGTSFAFHRSQASGLLRNGVNKAIQNRTPFSFIRLNDGEGALLYAMDEFKLGFTFEGFLVIQKLWKGWFGVEFSNICLPLIDNLEAYYADLLSHASLIGVDYSVIKNWHLCDGFESKLGCYYAGLRVEKDRNNLPVINSDALYELEEEDKYLTSLLCSGIRVSCISCHPYLAVKLSARGINVVQNIIVPAEQQFNSMFSTLDEPGSHLNDYFPSILKSISNVDSSKNYLWIIGAGPLGKVYANELFKRGCCVLDIGAIIDGLMGFARRPRLKQFAD